MGIANYYNEMYFRFENTAHALNKALDNNQQWVEDGATLGVDAPNDIDGTLQAKCKEILDYVLSGKRAFSQDVIYFNAGGTTDNGADLTSYFKKA